MHKPAHIVLHIKRGEAQRATRRSDRDINRHVASLCPLPEAFLVLLRADAVVRMPRRPANLVEDGGIGHRAPAHVARKIRQPMAVLRR